MSIKIQCSQCNSSLNVSDKMAGKKGKCPKCGNILAIPVPGNEDDLALKPVEPDPGVESTSSGWGQSAASPLDDLLSEAGVKAAAEGPTCPACHAEVKPDVRICIECGYDFAEGRQHRTLVGYDETSVQAGMTETDKMMAKAEKELQETPQTVDDDDFGDGASSFLVAGLIGFAGLVLLGLGLLVVVLIDNFATDASTSALFGFVACMIISFVGRIWIMVVAFQEGLGHGFGTLFCDCYLLIYGFMRFNGLWVPTTAVLIGNIGMNISSLVMSMAGP